MSIPSDKVLIEVGLNENRTRAENRNIPYTPAEIAAAARACYGAGASIVHYHGRREDGEPALSEPGPNVEAQRLISEATPLVAYPSYAEEVRVLDYYEIGTPAAERYRHIVAGVAAGVRYDVAPVDLGSFDVNAAWDASAQRLVPSSGLLMNSGHDQLWMLDFCRSHGLRPHLTVFDTAHFQNLTNLVHWKALAQPPYVVKFFLAGANAAVRPLLFFEERLRATLPSSECVWMPLVYGMDQLPLCAVSLALGGHVRVGIGDYPYRELGEPTNAELVERAVQLARGLGREPASPEDARSLMGATPSARPLAQP